MKKKNNITIGIKDIKNNFKNIFPLLMKENFNVWRTVCITITGVGLALFLSSFFISDIANFKYLYLVIACVYAGFAGIFILFGKKLNNVTLMGLVYISALTLCVFGSLLGTLYSPDSLSVFFMLLIVVMPLLILDRTVRLFAFTLIIFVLNIIFIIIFKAKELMHIEIIDTIIYLIISLIVARYVNQYRFAGFLEEYRVSQQIEIDALTGLHSELSYLKTIDAIDKRIKSGTVKPFAVVMMDVNNLKTTNDMYGHIYGCSIVVEAGKFIMNNFAHSKCFHIGGDEFLAILEGEDYENRAKLIEIYDEKMKDYYIKKNGITLRVLVSRGIAEYTKNDEKFRDVLDRADKLMYKNKKYLKELYKMPER